MKGALITRSRMQHISVQKIVDRLEVQRQNSGDIFITRAEVERRHDEVGISHATVCVAVAGVLKTLADTFCYIAAGSLNKIRSRNGFSPGNHKAFDDLGREALFGGKLYRKVFGLLEQAKNEAGGFTQPRAIDPTRLIGDEIFGVNIEHLGLAADNVAEVFEADFGYNPSDKGFLPSLLEKLRLEEDVAAGNDVGIGVVPTRLRRGEAFWERGHFRELYRLWILIYQELVSPGLIADIYRNRFGYDMEDIFLMTDPVALARYQQKNRTEELEKDIRYEVLRGQTWNAEDIEYYCEIRELMSRGVVKKLASFWHMSPHPPIFEAKMDGYLHVGSDYYVFKKGQQIVWACPMLRDAVGTSIPIFIDHFYSRRVLRLCGGMSNTMMGKV